MKKKELLIIFLLAVLVTGLSWFVTRPSNLACLPSVIPFANYCIMIRLPTHADRGYPVPYWKDAADRYPIQITPLNFFVDFLFWFLALAGGWWMVRRVRK